MEQKKIITYCPVTVQDVRNANQIFGLDLANLRGKMTRTKPEHVRVDYMKIYRVFIKIHKYVTLVADVLFVNGLRVFVTSLRRIILIMIEFLPLQTVKRLVLTLEQVIRVYGVAGFIVQVASMDMEFEKLKDVLPNITINTMAAKEHVGEIERKIQVIKERARGMMATLPYLTLPLIMIIKLMHFCVLWLNSFPVKAGVSEKWSPRELILHHWLFWSILRDTHQPRHN
jgi:hypothetical protein